ncbi:MAG TPA: hypothetical protein P5514_05840 [Bacteroidales bacterium]|nr:hypothetical protein [Bacteroidales bacterium]HPE58095.1 hypothetical protein [Bacteroidales bacterium]HRX96448.1 hypothetical protein [Bacteroidales bacterium]
MVKGNPIRRKRETPQARLNSVPIIKGVLIILVLAMFTPVLKAQESDTLSMGESKAQTLKYLKSLATIEKENCDRAKFIEEYEIDLTSAQEVLITKDSWIKREPADDAKNCNTLIPQNAIVKIYSSSCSPGFYAVKYKNKWGFISADVVEHFE